MGKGDEMFKIRIKEGSEIVEREPVIGELYCGFTSDDGAWERSGDLAEYVGDGVFVDECGDEIHMLEYDYLVMS